MVGLVDIFVPAQARSMVKKSIFPGLATYHFMSTGCHLCRRAPIEKIDVGALLNSIVGEETVGSGGLERLSPGLKLICIGLNCFVWISIDLGGLQSQDVLRPVVEAVDRTDRLAGGQTDR